MGDNATIALSDRQYDVLDTLFSSNSFSPESRMTTEEIAAKLQVDPSALKDPASFLSSKNLVRSKKGRGGGLWLSEIGKKQVEMQRKR